MRERTFGPVVTISASYGAGGSVIAPRLADALHVPFIDRAISPEDPDSPQDTSGNPRHCRSEEGLSEGEQEATPTGRFLSYFARAASVGAMVAPDPLLEDDDSIRVRTEAPLRPLAAGSPGVVLGRAGAVVLAGRPRAFHVRLDAPVDRRLKCAIQFERFDEDTVRRRQAETDRARAQFVKRLYKVDPSDPRLYHVMLDTTVLGIDRAIDVLVTAANAYFEANP